jgi:putative hydrolase of the HAD superfamily
MIKAVLFDFGGVLTESGKSGFINQTIAGLYSVDPDKLNIGKWHQALRRGKGNADDLFAELNKKYNQHVTKEMFVERARSQLQPAQVVYDLAARLRAKGIRTGILSNIFAMNAQGLRQQGLYDGFDPIVLSCEEGYAKPDKEFYEIAINKLGINPHEVLFVDDQDKCIGPAEEFGMYTVTAADPQQIVNDVTRLIETVNVTTLST